MWKLHKLNSLSEAVDPSVEGDFPKEEAAYVLKIGLLCTQASAAHRPSMPQVLEMLTNHNSKFPEPNQPPFLNARAIDSQSTSRSHSTNSSVLNGARKMEMSYTSSECSSTGLHSLDGQSGGGDLAS